MSSLPSLLRHPIALACASMTIAGAAMLAACGGGGSSGSGYGPNPGGSSAPQTSPGLQGTLNVVMSGTASSPTYGAAANAAVVFSCGCTSQAGTASTDSGGLFTAPMTAPATPAAPNPTYTVVPGRNYILVATTSSHGEAWSMEFAGTQPSHDQALGSGGHSDIFSAAASLYVFQYASGTIEAFDAWNFNTVSAWAGHLASSPNASEQKLLADIVAANEANTTLYPHAPGWNGGQSTNATIATDLAAVHSSGDSSLPTPCPGGPGSCTGTPTP